MDITNDFSIAIGLDSLSKAKEEEQSALRIKGMEDDGDTVEISDAAYDKLAASSGLAAMATGENAQDEESSSNVYMRVADGSEGEETKKTAQEKLIETLEKQIEKLEEEIRELQQSNLPAKQKEKLIAQKESELQLLQHQLLEAKEKTSEGGGGYRGGTRAEGGLGSSLT